MIRNRRSPGPPLTRLEELEPRVTPSTLPDGFTESLWAGGMAAPTAMDFAPDGRLFVAEQGGRLRVVKDGHLLPTPFVSLNVDSSGERGLLDIAFDPNFATDHFVYVYYTVPGAPAHNRVSRFTANADVAVPGSETPILDLDPLSSATNHNGGGIHFGPDGKLYVGVGENANGGNAQTLANRLGKLLRINPDGSIPGDNPFLSQAAGANRAIWALGLRNPFTFAFQPGTGRLLINDVGAATWEEINDGVAGANYGWPITEGPTSDPRFRGPIFAYGHGNSDTQGIAITGGAFYNPTTPSFPTAYVGDYFFADLGSDWIRRLHPADNSVTLFATGLAANPVDLKVGSDGSLFYLSHGTGSVYRIQYSPPRVAVAAASSGSLVTFVVTTNNALYRNDSSGWVQLGAPGTVLSVSAVNEASDNAVVFAVTTNHALARFDSRVGWAIIGAPGTVDQASAGTDPAGRADVFALTTGDAFDRFDASGWAALGAPRTVLSMSATGQGRVAVVSLDRSVLTFDAQRGWAVLSPAADFAQSVTATTDAGGNLVLFAVGVDGSLSRHDASGWVRLGNPGTISTATAGTGSGGKADVFVQAGGGHFLEFDPVVGWQDRTAPGPILGAIAADRNRVLAVLADGSLREHDDPFGWFALTGPGFVHA